MWKKLSKTAKVILAGSLLVLALGGSATYYYVTEMRVEEEPFDLKAECAARSMIAEVSMEFRQKGKLFMEAFEYTEEFWGRTNPKYQKFALNMVVRAYDFPRLRAVSEQAVIARKFGYDMYKECLKEYLQ